MHKRFKSNKSIINISILFAIASILIGLIIAAVYGMIAGFAAFGGSQIDILNELIIIFSLSILIGFMPLVLAAIKIKRVGSDNNILKKISKNIAFSLVLFGAFILLFFTLSKDLFANLSLFGMLAYFAFTLLLSFTPLIVMAKNLDFNERNN